MSGIEQRLLAWAIEQISNGYEIGRYRDGQFEPLMLAEALDSKKRVAGSGAGRSTTACDDQDSPEKCWKCSDTVPCGNGFCGLRGY